MQPFCDPPFGSSIEAGGVPDLQIGESCAGEGPLAMIAALLVYATEHGTGVCPGDKQPHCTRCCLRLRRSAADPTIRRRDDTCEEEIKRACRLVVGRELGRVGLGTLKIGVERHAVDIANWR